MRRKPGAAPARCQPLDAGDGFFQNAPGLGTTLHSGQFEEGKYPQRCRFLNLRQQFRHGFDVTDGAFWTASLDVIRARITAYDELAATVG